MLSYLHAYNLKFKCNLVKIKYNKTYKIAFIASKLRKNILFIISTYMKILLLIAVKSRSS